MKSILLFSGLWIIFACNTTTQNKPMPSDQEDVVPCAIFYSDSTRVGEIVGDSLSVQCIPNPKGIEKNRHNFYWLKGLKEGQRYKVVVTYGIKNIELSYMNNIYRGMKNVIILIPKTNPLSGEVFEPEGEQGGGPGPVIKGKE